MLVAKRICAINHGIKIDVAVLFNSSFSASTRLILWHRNVCTPIKKSQYAQYIP